MCSGEAKTSHRPVLEMKAASPMLYIRLPKINFCDQPSFLAVESGPRHGVARLLVLQVSFIRQI